MQLSDLNITWNDILPPRWSNNQSNNTFPKINDTIQFNISWVDYNLSTSIFSWNCSNLWMNTTIAQSGENITFVYNKTLNYTKDFNSCSYKFYANDSTNNWNETTLFTLNIDKQIPTITVEITPSPAVETDNLSCIITYSDADNDTWALNETKWHNNSVYLSNLDNLTKIQHTNTSNGDEWICQARVKDTFNYSIWVNDSIVINDSSPPSITAYTLSQSSYLTSEYMKFSVNVTDTASPMDWCKLTLQSINYSMVKVSNTYFNYTHSDTLGEGAKNISFIYCQDTSGNLNTTISNLLFTVSAPVAGSGGGGGSITILINQTNATELLKGYDVLCNRNSVCEPPNEDIWSCEDCTQFSTQRDIINFLSGKGTIILRLLIVAGILSIIYLYLAANYPHQLRKYGIYPSKKKRDWF